MLASSHWLPFRFFSCWIFQVVGESGLFTPDDIAYVQEAGVKAVSSQIENLTWLDEFVMQRDSPLQKRAEWERTTIKRSKISIRFLRLITNASIFSGYLYLHSYTDSTSNSSRHTLTNSQLTLLPLLTSILFLYYNFNPKRPSILSSIPFILLIITRVLIIVASRSTGSLIWNQNAFHCPFMLFGDNEWIWTDSIIYPNLNCRNFDTILHERNSEL